MRNEKLAIITDERDALKLDLERIEHERDKERVAAVKLRNELQAYVDATRSDLTRLEALMEWINP